MLDLAFLRDNLELVKQKMRDRGLPDNFLDDFDELDRTRRHCLVEAENLKARRNKLAEEIAARKKQKQDASAQMEESKNLKSQIEDFDAKAKAADDAVRSRLPF